ncbi:MAG TPA: hypothetical protein PKL44_00335 [Candidatus Dojkabacteria bacterium]|nr:hypothetical protein [Candidatus Dojkabacteria bacterium]
MKIKFLKQDLRSLLDGPIETQGYYKVTIWTEEDFEKSGNKNMIGNLYIFSDTNKGRFISIKNFRDWYRKGYFKIIKEYDS